ncbi:sulfite exporter TauE/SafE family protein [Phyllobacterium salinisoli]|uniref:sulfite exporter TauE/SafE family protein n=1 Tax=Phyllobacterium salinisoli TaxID=1899321 RepID=UPI001FE0E9B8
MALGVLIGVVLAGVSPGALLTAVFGVVAALVALHMLLTPEGMHLMKSLPARPFQALMATIIGVISILMGIGGGTLTVPTLSLCNYPVRRAVGTASVIGLIIALPGAIGFVSMAGTWATFHHSHWAMSMAPAFRHFPSHHLGKDAFRCLPSLDCLSPN